MRIVRITTAELHLPFRAAFAHASAERSATASLWVTVETECGHKGHGESCPRPYVTGETVASALRFLAAHRQAVAANIRCLDDLAHYAVEHAPAIDANSAAFAALELAVLDALGNATNQSVEAILGLPELAGTFHYTAVIGTGTFEHFRGQLTRYRELGFETLKLKLSGDADLDRTKLQHATASGMRLRVDANNLWDSVDAARIFLQSLDVPLTGIEEPLTAGRHEDLSRLAEEIGIPIILDESLLRLEQLPIVVRHADRFIANVRVAKMGGLMRSLAMIDALRAGSVPIIVGAHVGETSLLTRAGLTCAARAGDGLVGHEGAFGTHLLCEDVCQPPLMFGSGGRLTAPPAAAGWGLLF